MLHESVTEPEIYCFRMLADINYTPLKKNISIIGSIREKQLILVNICKIIFNTLIKCRNKNFNKYKHADFHTFKKGNVFFS